MSHLRHGTLKREPFTAAWNLTGEPQLWAGVVAGVVMIVAAIRLRRYRDEV
jgi:hypothetical protein